MADSTKVIAWWLSVGPVTAAFVQKLIDLRPTGLRSALGLRRIDRSYDAAQLEEACERVQRLGATSCKPVERMLRLAPQQQDRAETGVLGKTPLQANTELLAITMSRCVDERSGLLCIADLI